MSHITTEFQSQMLSIDELAKNVGYYRLYSDLMHPDSPDTTSTKQSTCMNVMVSSNQNSRGKDSTSDKSISHNENKFNEASSSEDGGDDHCYWIDDEWTNDDIRKVEDRLRTAKEKYGNDDNSLNSSKVKYKQQIYEKNASKNWDRFYKTHLTNFFKDRHYLHKEFPNEFGKCEKIDNDASSSSSFAEVQTTMVQNTKPKVLVEIGCGVGNNVLPLLEENDNTNNNESSSKKYVIYGFDFSSTAIDLLCQDERYIEANKINCAHANVWDITTNITTTTANCNSDVIKPSTINANITMLLFCLSAIHPEKMKMSVQNVIETLCDEDDNGNGGGVLLFRDYGRYDEAQIKLATNKNNARHNNGGYDNFYVKTDGTRCYYFTTEDVYDLFVTHGQLDVLELRYIQRIYVNRSNNNDDNNNGEQPKQRRRVWVQGRFRKKKKKEKER